MCLAHGLDAERGGQLAEEQPRSSPRRAVRHGVEERAQRCSGGAVARRRGSQPARRRGRRRYLFGANLFGESRTELRVFGNRHCNYRGQLHVSHSPCGTTGR